jgi:Uma2 family endonuclease
MVVSLKTPLVLVTDADLERVSHENPGYRFERERDGSVTVSPTSNATAAKEGEAFVQLRDYAARAGGKAFPSSAGYKLDGDKLVKSPDASWVSRPRIDALAPQGAKGFWPIAPDVAIDVRSPPDDFRETVAKLDVYLEFGTVYAVAIDPETRAVVEKGIRPSSLALDFDAIVDA